MRRLLFILALLLAPVAASAQTVLHSPPLWCELGGEKVKTSGLNSANEVMRSIPSCNVVVYNAGTVNIASIFSDALATPTPKANPFTALANGKIDFYAAAACYDIVTSGGSGTDTFPTPITYFGVCFGGAGGGGGGGGGGGSVTSVGFSAPAGFSVSGSPVTGVGTLALSMPAGWTSQDLLIGAGANAVARLGKGADNTCLTLVGGTITWGAGPCVGIPPGTTGQIVNYANGPGSILGNSSLFDDGSNPVQAPNGLSVMSNGLPRVITNANPATTVLNQLVERNASGFAVNASLGSSRALGVAGQNAGVNSAALQVTSVGYGTCVFDGGTTINDYVVPSATTAGLCHDAGATRPLNSEVIGTVTTANSGAGTTAIVDFFTGDTSQTTPSAVAPCGSSPGPFAYYTAASTIGCDVLMLTDGAGNGTMTSLTFAGSPAGYLFFTASSQPTFSVANSAYIFAPTSIPATYALKLPSALGTAGQALVITGISSNVATMGFSAAAGCAEGTCIVNHPASDQTLTSSVSQGLIFSSTLSGSSVRIDSHDPTFAVPMITLNSVTNGDTAINFAHSGVNDFTLYHHGGGAVLAINDATIGDDVWVINAGASLIRDLFVGATSGAVSPLSGRLRMTGSAVAGPTCDRTVNSISTIITESCPLSGTFTGVYNGTIGATTPSTAVISGLTLSAITGSTQCLHVNTSGVVSGTAGDCATGGSGTVTSIATTSPITGGTITTTGTIACATCVVASSPGLGLAHFAGSTQTVTSSLIVNADITAATIDLTTKVTGILPSANGGTANAFFTVSGPATSAKTFTFPNASSTVLTSNAAVTVAQGGTGITSGASGGIPAYVGATTIASSGVLAANALVLGGGAGIVPATAAGLTTDGVSILTLGVAGTSVGEVDFKNATSGTVALKPITGALGSVTISLPAATGTVAVSATSPITLSATGNIACATCGVTSNGLNQFASTTSAQLAGIISDETGSGGLVFATSPTLVTPVLGTPTSVTLTNATGLPISTGVSGLATGVATFLATPSSANLAFAVTDETGSGALVFGTSPTLTTASLGSSTATTQTAKDNSTKLATTAYVDAPTGLTAGTSISLTGPRQYFVCTGTCTVTPPVPVAGYEFCVMNDDNIATVITLAALGSSARYENTARTAYGTAGTGTFVSAGAVGNKVCIVGRDATHYLTVSFNGVWTAN